MDEIKPSKMYSSIENATAEIYLKHLRTVLPIYGVDCILSRKVGTVEDEVYGIHAGVSELYDVGKYKILFSTSQWRIIDQYESGYLDDLGWIYCDFDLNNGDIIKIKRSDDKMVKVQATGVESVGITTSILKRFRVSNLGDT
jgi:hypothetical protein